LFKSPFADWQKVLFIFGYFFVYEYNVISRSYGLSVLLLFAIAAFYARRQQRPIIYLLLLFLLGNTNIHGFVLSVILLAAYVGENVYDYYRGKIELKKIFLVICLSFLFVLPLLELRQPLDLPINSGVSLNFVFNFSPNNLQRALVSFVRGFLPLPQFGLNFWESNWIFGFGEHWFYLGGLLWLLTFLIFVKKPRWLLLYSALSAGLLCIFFFKYAAVRHCGLLYIVFVFCYWLMREEEKINGKTKEKFLIKIFLAIILSVQLFTAGIATYYEFKYRFSNGEAAAVFLQENNLVNDQTVIATYGSNITGSILPYLSHERRFFCLEYNDWCSFMVFDNQLFAPVDKNILTQRINRLIEDAGNNRQNLILIFSNSGYLEKIGVEEQFVLFKEFQDSIFGENYYIYRLKK
jgi:hypothetical protein